MGDRTVHLATVATATPPFTVERDAAKEFFAKHYTRRLKPRSLKIMNNMLAHPSIMRRHLALDDTSCLVDEDPDRRIARFKQWAVDLSVQAVDGALRQCGAHADQVAALVVNTCTGYICPGISSYLIERMGFSRNTRAYDLVGSGCGGAVPNLQMGASLLRPGEEGVAVCVSVEICSATFQMDDHLDLIVSNAIFADGAAATVLWTRPKGWKMIASSSHHAPEHRELIRYVHKKGQLHNQLSRSLPRVIGKPVSEAVQSVLMPQELSVADIDHWAVHGGGQSIISSVQKELGISDSKLRATTHTLANYGNMSSPSVLFTLKEIIDHYVETGDRCMVVAFGAGLSTHALLLQAV
jgi:predicted naringenin-chalcone synthase